MFNIPIQCVLLVQIRSIAAKSKTVEINRNSDPGADRVAYAFFYGPFGFDEPGN